MLRVLWEFGSPVKQVIAEGLTCFGDSADALRRRFGCKVLGSITCGTF